MERARDEKGALGEGEQELMKELRIFHLHCLPSNTPSQSSVEKNKPPRFSYGFYRRKNKGCSELQLENFVDLANATCTDKKEIKSNIKSK